jgi:dimethylsulfone monooxygenase
VDELGNIVRAETEREARDFYDYYVNEKGDWEAAANMVATFSAEINERNYSAGAHQAVMQEAFIQGWGGLPLIGTKEQIVDGLATLSDAASTACCWRSRATRQGMREFRDTERIRCSKQAGLRDFL